MKVSALDMSKYTSIRMKLAQQDSSDSDAQDDQIPLIVSQLLPNYYKYRRYLVQFLKQNHVNLKNYPNIYLPDSHIQERIKKCADERIFFQKKGNKKDHKILRSLVTEKLIQKNRKKLKQQRELIKKYQAKQIDAILEQDNQYGRSPKLLSYQQPSFDQRHFRRRSSTEQMFQGQKNNQISDSKSKLDSKASNSSNIGQSQNQKQRQKIIENGKTSQVIQKIKNKNIKIIDDEQQYEYQYEEDDESLSEEKNNNYQNQINKQRRHSKTHKDHKNQANNKKKESKIPQKKLSKKQIQNYPQIPKIKMKNKVQSPSDRSEEPESDQSGIESNSQQFFISKNKLHANIVSIDHEDTYSEYKLKPLVRQNTPNFDTFSQKVKSNNFYELQKQKLLNQMQQAQKIHNQISVVIGQTEEQDNGKLGTSRNNNNNNILQNLSSKAYSNNTSQKISDFIYSFKYILEEICELNSYSQCYKYLLKNKQYEIITCLYEQKIGNGPVYSKALMKKVQQLIKKQQKASIDFILRRIFGSQPYISFQGFSQVFTTNISATQYSIISVKATQIHSHNVPELLSRLFSIWLQIQYFQQKLRKLYSANSTQSDQICEKMTETPNRNTFDFEKIEKFLYSSSHNRANLLKVKLCFNKYFKFKKFNEFISLLQKKL